MKFITLFSVALAFYYVVGISAQKSIQEQNADDAETLQKKFESFDKNTKCTANDEACIGKDFAQCTTTVENGKNVDKFVTTSCGGGDLECVVLPLVLKRGTSITCATKQEQKNRLDAARGKNTAGNSSSKRSPKEPTDITEIRKLNADDAEALQNKFKSFKADQKCSPNENACVNDQFAQCSGAGVFSLQPCAAGLKCFALPLVNARGTSITCDTEEDRENRFKQARGQN